MPPSFTGPFDSCHFSTLVMPLVLVKAQARLSVTGAPINSNLRASNSMPGRPKS